LTGWIAFYGWTKEHGAAKKSGMGFGMAAKKDLKLRKRVFTRYSVEQFVTALAEHVPDHYPHAVRDFGLLAPGTKSKTSAALFVLLRQEERCRPRG
jgi:hypothetical protein